MKKLQTDKSSKNQRDGQAETYWEGLSFNWLKLQRYEKGLGRTHKQDSFFPGGVVVRTQESSLCDH